MEQKNYVGCTESQFKTRQDIMGTITVLGMKTKKSSTTLTALVLEKDENPKSDIEWSILKKKAANTPLETDYV